MIFFKVLEQKNHEWTFDIFLGKRIKNGYSICIGSLLARVRDE